MIALLFAISFVLVAELVNTALEATVDVGDRSLRSHGQDRPRTWRPVPCSSPRSTRCSSATSSSSTSSRVVAENGLAGRAQSTPPHLTVIALALTGLAVLALKARPRGGHLPARRMALGAHRARGRGGDGDRLLDRTQRRCAVLASLHRRARGPEPGRERHAHDPAGRLRRGARIPHHDGRLSGILGLSAPWMTCLKRMHLNVGLLIAIIVVLAMSLLAAVMSAEEAATRVGDAGRVHDGWSSPTSRVRHRWNPCSTRRTGSEPPPPSSPLSRTACLRPRACGLAVGLAPDAPIWLTGCGRRASRRSWSSTASAMRCHGRSPFRTPRVSPSRSPRLRCGSRGSSIRSREVSPRSWRWSVRLIAGRRAAVPPWVTEDEYRVRTPPTPRTRRRDAFEEVAVRVDLGLHREGRS